jgi:hypothetical protein
MEKASLKCDELEAQHPELAGKIRKCNIADYCSQDDDYALNHDAACMRGYTQSVIDLGIAVKDTAKAGWSWIDQRWDQFRTDAKNHAAYIHACVSLECKRDIVKDDHRYNTLSDQELAKLPADFLYIQAHELAAYKASIDRSPYGDQGSTEINPKQTISPEQRWKYEALKKAVAEKISDKWNEYQCLSPLAKEELECYAIGTVVDPTVVVGYFAKAIKVSRAAKALEEAAEVERLEELRIGEQARKQPPVTRAEFKEKYLEYSPTTAEQNAEWDKIANNHPSGTLFAESANGYLQEFNLVDKELSTSLTNYHKKMLFDKVADLEKKYPGLKVAKYSDYKNTRFAFSGKIPWGFKKEFDALIASTNKEFAAYVKQNRLVRTEDHPEKWFRNSMDYNADAGSLAARQTQGQSSAGMQSMGNIPTRKAVQQSRKESENLRKDLRSSFAGTDVVDGKSLSADTFDLVRKSKGNAEKLKSSLKARYPEIKDVSNQQAAALYQYTSKVDSLQASNRILKREMANLSEAEHGGLSADIIGLGSDNLKGTAEALAKGGSIEDMIEATRAAHNTSTVELEKKKKFFLATVEKSVDPKAVKRVCSGDDCVAVPTSRPWTLEEKQKIVQNLADSEYAGRFRYSFIPEGVKNPEARTLLAVHGEDVEKAMRSSLNEQLPAEKLKGLTFTMDMQTTELNQGGIQLITGTTQQTKLSAEDSRKIQEAFKKAVEDVNKALSKDGKTASYQAVAH